MIYSETYLQVADNSGAKLVQCIKVLKSLKWASVGDTIVVSIKECLPHKKIKKGDVRRAVIVRVKKELVRQDGSSVTFSDNAVVLINDQGNPIGTQVKGPIARELRNTKWAKITSLAPNII